MNLNYRKKKNPNQINKQFKKKTQKSLKKKPTTNSNKKKNLNNPEPQFNSLDLSQNRVAACVGRPAFQPIFEPHQCYFSKQLCAAMAVHLPKVVKIRFITKDKRKRNVSSIQEFPFPLSVGFFLSFPL